MLTTCLAITNSKITFSHHEENTVEVNVCALDRSGCKIEWQHATHLANASSHLQLVASSTLWS
jgi:hypothetical protein